MATISRVKEDESDEPYRLLPISSANIINLPLNNIEKRGAISGVIAGDDTSDKDACWETSEVIYVKHETCGEIAKHTVTEEDGRSTTEDHKDEIVVSDEEVSHDNGYTRNDILARSRHRDSSIYRGMGLDTWWKEQFCTADRNETRLEAMALSDPTDCIIDDGSCIRHQPNGMLQILSLELAEISVDGGLVELYGYIAVRDNVDGLLNYVVSISRDEPIIATNPSLRSSINQVGAALEAVSPTWLVRWTLAHGQNHHQNPSLKNHLDDRFIWYGIPQEQMPDFVHKCIRQMNLDTYEGSLINMAGPQRGVHMTDLALIEYDLRIKTGEQEKDDLYLIDGASMIGLGGLWNYPFTMRIPGDCGAVNITLARLDDAVEAIVEVLISEVQNSFSLFLGCLTSGLDKEIAL